MLFVYYVGLCFSYVMFTTAYVSTMQHTTLHSPKYAKSMLKLCLRYSKSTQLLNTYANTIQNLFIVLTYLLCNRKFCFSFRLASYVFTMHQSKIAFTQHLDLHFYFQQVSQLLHSATYILCYVMKHICSLCIHYVTFSFSFITR